MHENSLTPRHAVEYLKDKYQKKYHQSYLAKLRSVGGGARFYKIGSSVFYDPSDLDNWVIGNRTKKVFSSAELADSN